MVNSNKHLEFALIYLDLLIKATSMEMHPKILEILNLIVKSDIIVNTKPIFFVTNNLIKENRSIFNIIFNDDQKINIVE